MRSFRFDTAAGVIHTKVTILGPAREDDLTFALDTGASRSVISWPAAVDLGLRPEGASAGTEIITGSGVEYCPLLRVSRISALGQARLDFRILCHAFPPKLHLQGLLGLDFLAGRVLTVDFRRGNVRLG